MEKVSVRGWAEAEAESDRRFIVQKDTVTLFLNGCKMADLT